MTSRLLTAGGDYLVDADGNYLVWELDTGPTGRMSLALSAPSMSLALSAPSMSLVLSSPTMTLDASAVSVATATAWLNTGSGVQGMQTPDGADLSAQAYWDVRWAGTAASWRPGASFGLWTQSNNLSHGIGLAVLTTGKLRFQFGTGSLATTNYDTTVALPAWDSDTWVAIRFVYDAAASPSLSFQYKVPESVTGDVAFNCLSARSAARSSAGWTTLENVAGPSVATRDTQGAFKVGWTQGATALTHNGYVAYCDVRTAAGGPIVRSLDPLRAERVAPDVSTLPDVVNLATMGDSITIRQDLLVDGELALRTTSWGNVVAMKSEGRALFAANAAVAGYDTADMLADFPALLATGPNVVGILGGTNDTTLADTQANITAMVELAQTAGVGVLLGTVPPKGMVALGTPTAPELEVSSTGGTLGAGTYSYKVAWITGNATAGYYPTLCSAAATVVISSGTTNSIRVRAPFVHGMEGWRVYGRSAGSEELIATVNSANGTPSLLYTDTGSVTPSGAQPVANTTAIDTWSPAEHQLILDQNVWLASYAAANGIMLVDFSSVVASGGLWRDGYSFDGLHPTPKGSAAMADAALAVLEAEWPTWPAASAMPITVDSGALDNLQINGTFAIEDGLERPYGWARNALLGTGSNFTYLTATRGGFVGKAFTLELSKADTLNVDQTGVARVTGLTPGARLLVSAVISTDGFAAGGASASLALKPDASTSVAAWTVSAVDIDRGIIAGYVTVPVGVTTLFFRASINSGVGSLSIGQVTVYDLDNDPQIAASAASVWPDPYGNAVSALGTDRAVDL